MQDNSSWQDFLVYEDLEREGKLHLRITEWLPFDDPIETLEPITPFRGLYAAVTRKNEAGTNEYFPDEKLTIEEAIEAYTSGVAYAEFAEKAKGELVPGKWADLVVLDRDITQISPEAILGSKVLRTVVAGKTVYEAH